MGYQASWSILFLLIFEPILFREDISYKMCSFYNQARALRALGLLLADGAPTVGGGKTF